MGRVSKARIRELCGVTKGAVERIDKRILRWFSYVERMEYDKIDERVYVGKLLVVASWVSRGSGGLIPRRTA